MERLTSVDFAKWKDLFHETRSAQKDWITKCEKNVKAYKKPSTLDLNNPGLAVHGERSSPNLIRRFVQNRRSAHYVTTAEIDVIAEDYDLYTDTLMGQSQLTAAQAAMMMEKVLNDLYRDTLQGQEDQDVIADAIMFGLGVKVHGYHTEMFYDPHTDVAQYQFGPTDETKRHSHFYRIGPNQRGTTSVAPDGHFHRISGQLVYLAGEGKGQHTHVLEPAYTDQDGVMSALGEFRTLALLGYDDPDYTYSERIRAEWPWGQAVRPWYFVMDPDAKRLTDARWAAWGHYKSIRELKRDPRLRNTQEIEVKQVDFIEMEAPDLLHYRRHSEVPQTGGGGDTRMSPDTQEIQDQQRVMVWTVFIKSDPVLDGEVSDKILIMAEDAELPFRYMDNTVHVDVDGQPYLPFSTLSWNHPGTGQFLPDDLEDWIPLVYDYLDVRAAVNRQTEVEGTNKTLYDPIELSADLADLITAAPPNSFVGVEGLARLQEKLRDVLVPVPINSVSQDMYMLRESLRQEIRDQSGENELSRGTPLPSKRTATEVYTLTQARQAAITGIQEQIGVYVGRSAWIYGSLIQKFYRGRGKTIKLSEERIVPFNADAIRRRFRYEMRENSATPQTRELRRQQQLAFVTQFMQSLWFLLSNFPAAAQKVNLDGLLEMWRSLCLDFDIPGVNKIFAPAPGQLVTPTKQPSAQGMGVGRKESPGTEMDMLTGTGAAPQLAQSLTDMQTRFGR